jgi:hypothetical protein
MRSQFDERATSLSIAFPSPSMFAHRVIDARSEVISQHLFPIWSPSNRLVFRIVAVDLKLIANPADWIKRG